MVPARTCPTLFDRCGLDSSYIPSHRDGGKAIKIIITDSATETGALAADIVAALVRAKPDAVLGLATGSSPLPLYAALQDLNLDLSSVSGFALDEYVGLGAEHSQSYAQVIRREVVDRLSLQPFKVRVPDGMMGAGSTAVGKDYEQAIADAGGVDLQVLGIGSHGHLAFNEPLSSFTSRTRMGGAGPEHPTGQRAVLQYG